MSKFPIVTFRDYEIETINEGLKLNHVQVVVLDKLYKNFIECIDKNRKTLEICKVKKVDEIHELPKYKVVIKSPDFINIKNKLIDYYEGLEDYSKCAKLVSIKL